MSSHAATSSTPPPDQIAASLVERVAAGDARAETEFVQQYGRGLRFFLRRLTRDGDLVEDLFQTTFCVVIERLRHSGLEDPEGLAPFLRGTARNLFRNEERKRIRRKTESGDERFEEVPDGAPGSDPLRRLLHSEKMALVRKLLVEMRNPRDREILFRVYLAEEEMEDISRDLDLELDHFYRVLSRARGRLKELILKRADK